MFRFHSAALLLASLFLSVSAWAATTEFTYQGQLRESNAPSNGSYDFTFTLFDASSGGNQIGPVNQKTGQGVSNGVFTVLLDFGGNAFDGSERYLQISVRKAGSGSLTPLTPRQKVTSAPSAVNFTGALSGDVAGGQVGNTVITVGGLPAAQVASGANAANSATSEAAPGFIVLRDGNGNFKSAPPVDPAHAATKQYVDDLELELSAALVDIAAQAVAAEVASLNAAIGAVAANLSSEVTRATNAEAALTTSLNAEIAARQAAVATAVTSLNTEIARAQAAEAALTASLNAEVARATAAENSKVSKAGDTMTGLLTLSGNPTANLHAATKQYVDAETTRATGAEAALTTNLNAEITARTGAVTTLTTNLNNEVTRAQGAEATLTTNLNNEIAARTGAVTTLTTNLNNEVTRAQGAEAALTTNLNAEITRATSVETGLANSKVSKAGDTMTGTLTLSGAPTANLHAATKQYVDAETARATGAETTLTVNLASETTARQNAATTLTTNLNGEIARATAAEAALAAQLGAAASSVDLSNEIARAMAAEATKVSKDGDTMTGFLTLSGWPTEDQHAATKEYVDGERFRALQAEATLQANLIANSNALQGGINQVYNALAFESDQRFSADNYLTFTKLSKFGDNMGGHLTLWTDPVNDLHAAPKRYVDYETGRAQGAEFGLMVDLSNEIARATAAETALGSQIAATASSGALNAEIARAMAAESALGNSKVSKSGDTMTGFLTLNGAPTSALHAATKAYVDGEKTRAQQAESDLQSNITSEFLRALAAENNLQTNLSAESSARNSQFAGLNNALSFESSQREGADSYLTATKVSIIGDTMSGYLTLFADPTADRHAATKRYVDNETSRAQNAESTLSLLKVSKGGDTMTGLLTLSGAPTANLHAATKQYVDAETTRAQSAEATLTANLSAETTRATTAEGTKVSKAGDTMTGFLTLNANPTNSLHAATKQYVDAETTRAQNAETTLTTNLNSEIARATAAEGGKVAKAGDTMTGLLTLSGAPTATLHAATKQYVDTETTRATTAEGTKVSKTGDTMTGALTLSGAPTATLHAATKQYVDTETTRATAAEGTLTTNLNTEIARATAAEGGKVAKAGDTMTGSLTLNANPTLNLHAATKQYVDSETTRATAVETTLTNSINNETARATSAEVTLNSSKVAKTGDTMTGPLTLNANPASALHAATKQYVDSADSGKVDKASFNTITAQHLFNPAAAGSPFFLGGNAQGQLVVGLNADKLDGLDATAFLQGVTTDATMTGTGTAANPLSVVATTLVDGTTIIGGGTAADRVRVNLANSNIWTGLQTINRAGQGLSVTNAPVPSTTASLLSVGVPLVNGNTFATGGTYIGVNSPMASTPGGDADLIHLQWNGLTALRVDTFGTLTVGTNASSNLAIFKNNSAGNLIRFDSNGKGFFNGGTQTGGADVAELFDVIGERKNYEAGDVLALSTEKVRYVEKSQTPYSTLISGVVATKPGVLLTERDAANANFDDMVPMGVVGVIPTKICLENGPVKIGDPLVSSSIPGYAMKGTDKSRMQGAVIGKAMENFDGAERGLIKVLVNAK